MKNKEFGKFKWAYPTRNTSNFDGAVQEYALTDGGHIAVAFTTDGAFIFKDDDGYFDTIDYIAKDGLFHSGTKLHHYDEAIVVGSISYTETAEAIEDVAVDRTILSGINFADGVDTVCDDIKNRLKAVGIFGCYELMAL